MKCNLCGCEIVGYGNNPAPLIVNEDERCCDACNNMYVIPARILELSAGVRLDSENAAVLVRGIRRKEGARI